MPVEWLRDKNVYVVSGLGNPSGFLQTLRTCGAIIAGSIAFPDHHDYSAQNMREIEQQARGNVIPVEAILCTGKDLAKIDIPRLGTFGVWSLDVEWRIRTGAEVLDEHLERILNMCL